MESAANVSQQLSHAKEASKPKIKPANQLSSQDLLTDPLTDPFGPRSRPILSRCQADEDALTVAPPTRWEVSSDRTYYFRGPHLRR